MNQPLYNLHNHTPFSDGAYTIDELCEAHLDQKGLRIDGLGVCDHLFCTPSSRVPTTEKDFERVFGGEVRSYVAEVQKARERWAGKLRIFCGVEVNWPLNRHMLDMVRLMLTGVDYVLFEFVDWAGLTALAHQARRFPCPVGLAHADVSAQFPTTSLDQVVRTLANARIFYEINSKFLPLREDDPWYQILPQHRVQVTLGTDTHDDLRGIRNVKTLYDYAQRRGLGEKMLTPAPRELKQPQEMPQQALTA